MTDATYRRSFLLNDQAGLLSLQHRPEESGFRLQVEHPDPAALYTIAERCRRMLDLDAMPDDISRHLAQSPRLAGIMQEHPGLRLPVAWGRFEACVRAVLGQQVSVAAATTLLGRLVQRCQQTTERLPAGWLLFPEPDTLLSADLDGLGITGRRIDTLKHLAEAVLRGDLDLGGGDEDLIDQQLSQIPGIGPWTRAYVRLRGLGCPDALPTGDIVLRKALGNGDSPASDAQLSALAETWRPWRGYATMALWHAASTRNA